jgi:thiol-disulfide isomerase/thioredoxin
MRVLTISLIVLVCVGSVIGASVEIYHSPTCPHCQRYLPVALELSKQYSEYNFIVIDVTQGSYNIPAVPLTIISFDYGTVEFAGNNPKKLNCQLQQMSTLDCPTLSASSCTNDWFV